MSRTLARRVDALERRRRADLRDEGKADALAYLRRFSCPEVSMLGAMQARAEARRPDRGPTARADFDALDRALDVALVLHHGLDGPVSFDAVLERVADLFDELAGNVLATGDDAHDLQTAAALRKAADLARPFFPPWRADGTPSPDG